MKRSQAMAIPLPGGMRYFSTHVRLHVHQAVFLVLSLALVLGGCATGLQQARSPESVGFSTERLKQISAAFQTAVEKKEIPGAVVILARGGRIAYFETFGYQDRTAAIPMPRDAIFRIASMTKPVTSVAVMMLVEEGRISLSDPVSKYLPDFKDAKVGVEQKNASGAAELVLENTKREMTIIDLLRHTSGLTYGIFGKSMVKDRYNAAKLWDPKQSLAAVVTKISKLPLQNEPGTIWHYSMSTDVLGRVVEVVSGMELERFFAERIFNPLGMNDTGFWVSDPAKQGRIAQAQADVATGKMPAMPDKTKSSWPSGGGGLVSTAGDYARLCQMFLNGGELDGVRILSGKAVAQMSADQLPPGIRITRSQNPANDVSPETGHGFGLGFMVRTADGRSAFPGSVGDYSWTGLYGTQFWIDPRKEMFAIVMVQNAPSALGVSSRYWNETRSLVYGALTN